MNHENLQKLINLHIFANQSSLVESLLRQDFMWKDEEVMECLDHRNFYRNEEEGGGERETKEIFQWFLVSSWLAEKLKEIGEPILLFQGACWWGRTQCGIALVYDRAIMCVFENLQHSFFEVFKPAVSEE